MRTVPHAKTHIDCGGGLSVTAHNRYLPWGIWVWFPSECILSIAPAPKGASLKDYVVLRMYHVDPLSALPVTGPMVVNPKMNNYVTCVDFHPLHHSLLLHWDLYVVDGFWIQCLPVSTERIHRLFNWSEPSTGCTAKTQTIYLFQ